MGAAEDWVAGLGTRAGGVGMTKSDEGRSSCKRRCRLRGRI